VDLSDQRLLCGVLYKVEVWYALLPSVQGVGYDVVAALLALYQHTLLNNCAELHMGLYA
jgi:hypothetical protein